MKIHRNFFTIILGFTALLLVSSCSSNDAEEGNTRDALSAFVGANDNVVSFGNANLKSIMEKGDFKNVPKFGVLVSTEMETLESHIDMTTPVYYALEGPISDNGPAKTYAFVSIKNIDSLSAELTQRGFVMNKAGDMHYTEDGDFALGVKGKLGIIVTSTEEFEGEKLLKEALAMAEGDLSGGTVDEILSSEGDIVMGVSLENLYATSDTDLEDLSEEKQEEMKNMVDDSYVQTSFRFENGAAIIETKNYFSDALMARMFMKSDNNAPILAKLGKGEPKWDSV